MKIFDANQIKILDEDCILSEPIASIDLMERAALQVVRWYCSRFSPLRRIFIFCGPGNNGGDGLAIARLLIQRAYHVNCFVLENSKYTADNLANQQRLNVIQKFKIISNEIELIKQMEKLGSKEDDVILDAIFGVGIRSPLDGFAKHVVNQMNHLPGTKIAIDMPSGLFPDTANDGMVFNADYCLSFQSYKLSFLLPDFGLHAGEVHILPIGWRKEKMLSLNASYDLVDYHIAKKLSHNRSVFDHKGNRGHVLVIGGTQGKEGAALLAAKASLQNGAGLCTISNDERTQSVALAYSPEIMYTDISISAIRNGELENYKAVVMGPGLGTSEKSSALVHAVLEHCQRPLVLDADALNILSQNSSWQSLIPADSILTPHQKEFERLFGKSDNHFEQLHLQKQKSMELRSYIIRKGAFSCISSPNGNIWFNGSGNNALATAGSGDVLSGIIGSLLAQGYKAQEASLLGCYLHGLTAELNQKETNSQRMVAGDIITWLPKAWEYLRTHPEGRYTTNTHI